LQRIIRKKGGDTEKMSKFIEDSTEQINPNSEKMSSETEKITSDTEKIPEIIPEKIRHKGQRGPDKNKRRFNPNSLKNLMQNKNKIFEEKKPIWKTPNPIKNHSRTTVCKPRRMAKKHFYGNSTILKNFV